MSIRRWLAEKLCPELAKEAEMREDISVDPAVVLQDMTKVHPGHVLWYGDIGSATPKVRIEMTGPGRGDIWLNGEKQKNVVGFKLECHVGELNVLKIEYVDFTGEIVGDIDVADQGEPAT
jgi:hypothetical protein